MSISKDLWDVNRRTAWGDLNHANLDLRLGPLAYVLNGARMHLWHHRPSSCHGGFERVSDWSSYGSPCGRARLSPDAPSTTSSPGLTRLDPA